MKKIVKDSIKRFGKNLFISVFITLIIILINNCCGANISITINGDDNIYIVYLFGFCLLYTIVSTIIFYKKNKPDKIDIKYFRDHPKGYSPSIVSIIMDLKLDYRKDILADILYLENLKIVEIDYYKNCVRVISNYENLKEHLQIICQFLEQNQSLSIKNLLEEFEISQLRFNYEISCMEEAIMLGYLKKDSKAMNPYRFFLYIYLLYAILVLMFAIGSGQNILDYLLLIVILGFMFGLICLPLLFLLSLFQRVFFRNRKYIRTELGKEETKEWLAYYDFLTDFTRMYEKDLKYNELFDYEYAYAVALGINVKLKKSFNIEEGEIIR